MPIKGMLILFYDVVMNKKIEKIYVYLVRISFIIIFRMNLFHEVFLTRGQIDTLAKWKYAVNDRGVLSFLLDRFFNFIAGLVPRNVSPNALTLAGLIFSLYAYWFSTIGNTWVNNIVVATCILIYMTLDAIDGKHARNTKTSSPLGELFDHFCDCITNACISYAFCVTFNITSPWIIWLFILATQISFTKEHVYAYTDQNKMLHFGVFTGPTEVLCVMILLIYIHPLIGLSSNVEYYFGLVIFSLVCLYAVINIILIYIKIVKHYRRTGDYATLFGITFCLIFQIPKFFTLDLTESVANGVIFSTLCADLIIAKMANREVHQLIPVMHLVTCLLPIASIPLAIIYFLLNVYDISTYLKIPILNPTVNIFVSGYYDGFHIGHQRSLLAASRLGTRLIVGVHSQDDLIKKTAKKNQEPQEKNEVLRIAKVAEYKCVDEVVPRCPLVFTEELVKAYNIHIVGMSDEYILEKDENGKIISVDPFYEEALKLGILRIVPRTQGVSSTDLRTISTGDKTYEQLTRLTDMISQLNTKIDDHYVLPVFPVPLTPVYDENTKLMIDMI